MNRVTPVRGRSGDSAIGILSVVVCVGRSVVLWRLELEVLVLVYDKGSSRYRLF